MIILFGELVAKRLVLVKIIWFLIYFRWYFMVLSTRYNDSIVSYGVILVKIIMK